MSKKNLDDFWHYPKTKKERTEYQRIAREWEKLQQQGSNRSSKSSDFQSSSTKWFVVCLCIIFIVVCWVFKNSGVYPLSRTTAQGIFNQCSPVRPAEAKPGDIIFFTGTYNSGCPVSHVGIYVGNGMMIHCGNPIQYANVNSSYWSSHFYAYGRIGNDN